MATRTVADGRAAREAGREAWRLALVTVARVTAELERAAAESGTLSPTLFDLLATLDGTPGHRVRLGDLAEAVLLTRAGLSRLVDRAEAAGLLRREACPEDKRGAFAVLTDAGAAALRATWPVYMGVVDARFARALPDPAAAADALRAVLSANQWLPDQRPVQLTVTRRGRSR